MAPASRWGMFKGFIRGGVPAPTPASTSLDHAAAPGPRRSSSARASAVSDVPSLPDPRLGGAGGKAGASGVSGTRRGHDYASVRTGRVSGRASGAGLPPRPGARTPSLGDATRVSASAQRTSGASSCSSAGDRGRRRRATADAAWAAAGETSPPCGGVVTPRTAAARRSSSRPSSRPASLGGPTVSGLATVFSSADLEARLASIADPLPPAPPPLRPRPPTRKSADALAATAAASCLFQDNSQRAA